ncbi:MAG: ABC transporter permease [Acidobacteriota bacterium]
MNSIIHDLKYGLRQLRRSPGFTAVAVLTLALGIGATTAIFSVVNGVLLSPLPFPNPSRLVIVHESSSKFPSMSVSYLDFLDWRREQRTFSALAIYRNDSFILAERSGAEVVSARMVSAGFFKILGISPLIGRSFSPQDDHLGAGRTVILSYRFWQQHFDGDRAILGKTVTLGDKDYATIGVLPKNFWFFGSQDVYVPVGIYNRLWRTNRETHPGFSVVGRLRRGVTLAQAQSDMDNIARSLAAEYPKADAGLGVVLTSMPHDVVRDVRAMLYLLLGAVCLVLLIACVNVANLLLSRSTAREKEMAIRTALGARRQRIMRQLLIESVLLAFLGGVLGILLAGLGTHALLAYVPQELPRAHNVGVDFTVLLFVVAVSVVTGILFGLAPAFHSSSVDLRNSLQENSRGTTAGRHGLQNGLVVAEVGLALVLLVGAGLTLRSILHLYHVKTGFVTRGALVFDISLPASRYNSGPAYRAFYRQVTARIRGLPGVHAVGATTLMPMSGADSEIYFYVEGHSRPQPQNMPWAMFYMTTPGFQRAMGISLLRGRFFTDEDTLHSQPVVVIDDTLAQKLFHGQNPLGQHIIIPFKGIEAPREIVGVVHHIKHFGPAGRVNMKLEGAFYMPFAQIPDPLFKSTGPFDLTLVARTSVSAQSMVPAVKRAVHGIDNGVHEIGIRMALGAERRDVLRMVIAQGLKLSMIGLAIGIAAAFALTRFLSSQLYGIKPTDPLTFVAVSLILAAVALAACYFPARRATKVDPMEALRYE